MSSSSSSLLIMRMLGWPARLADRVVPDPSPLRNPRLALYFGISLVLLHATYHALSLTIFRGADPKKLKQRAWILTTVNALIMTAVSVPYLVDLLRSGFDLHAVQPRTTWLAEPMSCFFVAYLLSDLGLGSIFYRHLINLSSGWIHHTVYTFLFAFWVHKGWGYIAVMACVFELPTFIMGVASLHPPLRSNSAFTGTFFLTRVFFHFGLLVATVTKHGRSTPSIHGSWGPAISVIVTYPMHLWWGYKCALSVRRRMKKRKIEARKVREQRAAEAGIAAQYFASAGQLFTGLPDPSISSAVNTPATTPGSSPVLSAADKKPSTAFQRAAAVAGSPINLVLGRRRKDSDLNDANALSLGDSMTSGTAGHTFRPFTNSVRPAGATADDKEPFLAIRSEAETRDRARRLVADAIRKAWMKQPESWRKQLESEMQTLSPQNGNSSSGASAFQSGTSTAAGGSEQMSRRASGSGEASGVEDEGVDEHGALDEDTGVSSAIAASSHSSEQVARSRAQRGKAAARRAFVRAISRAINGPQADKGVSNGIDPLPDDADIDATLATIPSGMPVPAIHVQEATSAAVENAEVQEDTARDIGSLPGTLPGIDAVRDEEQAEQVVQEARRQHRLLQMLVRISGGGVSIPPDLLGQDYSVREFPVERDEQMSRQRRFVEQIRRRMEVANRDVVVFD